MIELLRDTLSFLAGIGYVFEFEAGPSGLYCARLDLRLAPDEFDVTKVYQFGENTLDEHILYVISSFDGIKGTLVLALHDVYAENISFEMAVKLRTDPYGEWICS